MEERSNRKQLQLASWRQIIHLLATVGCMAIRTSSFQFFPSNSPLSRRNLKSVHRMMEDVADATEVEQAIELGRSRLAKYFNFPLDDWQLQAGGEILMGHNVIVCSPTGSGKTVCGEMALHIAMERDLDGIYTTPLKALSNQKFADLRQIFGAPNVGLSTGDVSINRKNARLTVMTTEVYRNIAWRSSGPSKLETEPSSPANEWISKSNDLGKNAVVVLDELHYMGLPGRGGVWEECIITSPSHTQIIGLSATLPNAPQLADWMQDVTGRKTVLVEAPGARPVPLKYLFATREGLFPLFKNPDAGPGSPLGLLGYRGDGTPADGSKRKKRTGFEGDNGEQMDDEKLPRGLQVNPALETIAQRRMQKVNRSLERQKDRQRQRRGGFDDDLDLDGGGRGRGRRSPTLGKMSSREERKERERMLKREMRKAVPSLPILLTRLKEKNLLPAIFFIFSRAGCDQAAESIRIAFKGPRDPTVDVDFDEFIEDSNQNRKKEKKGRQKVKRNRDDDSMFEDENGRNFRRSSNYVSEDVFTSLLEEKQASIDDEDSFVSGSPLSSDNWKFYTVAGLLTYEEMRTVAGRVAQFNEENPEIAFPDNVVEQFLFGVGSHHAGMLPAHKAFVETLFRGNLMKVCFATETLAAGINMPARTTVVCALAKRDGSASMSLLETSNLLQIAGRAGRRGMDTAGTCVIVATPFESHDIAATILTNPIKPISSQFRPSYSLAVNLIARGQGKLDVAKQLVSKSFAMWEKRRLENEVSSTSDFRDILEAVAEDKFMNVLTEIFQRQVVKRSVQFDIAFLRHLVGILKDRELLKKSSKEYEGAALTLELEKTTLGCLELEMNDSASLGLLEEVDQILLDFQEEDQADLVLQIEEQRQRVADAKKKLRKSTFTSIVEIANELMNGGSEDGEELAIAFGDTGGSELQAEDLPKFAYSAIVVKRKLRKLAKANPDLDPESLLLQADQVKEMVDNSWDDMLAITKVLIAYGCLTSDRKIEEDDEFNDLEDQTLEVTPAGLDVGNLSFENSLWCFTAMGGTWDVISSSSKYDEVKDIMKQFEDDFGLFGDENEATEADEANEADTIQPHKPQQEAEELVSHLRYLSPGEMAGYVSCLVTGDNRRNSLSSIDIFQRLSTRQQRAIQVLLESTERLMDVQRQFSVDERTCQCQFDLTNSEVVTAWANGCTWGEAMEMSGAAPGDLTRIIGRAMDGVRQLGSLKFKPLRKDDFDDDVIVNPLSRGLHPEIRRTCREAAKAMNRYPVKDPLPFEAEEEDMFVEDAAVDVEDGDDAVVDVEDDGDLENSESNVPNGTSDMLDEETPTSNNDESG